MASPDYSPSFPIYLTPQVNTDPLTPVTEYHPNSFTPFQEYKRSVWKLTPENITAIREREWSLGEAVSRGEVTDPELQTIRGRRIAAIHSQVVSDFSKYRFERYLDDYGAFETAWRRNKTAEPEPYQPPLNIPQQLFLNFSGKEPFIL